MINMEAQTIEIMWFGYAGYIGSISFTIQQGLSLIMLLFFGSLIIKYRTTNYLFSDNFTFQAFDIRRFISDNEE